MLILILIIIIGITIFCEYKYNEDCYSMWDGSRFFTIPAILVSLIAIVIITMLLVGNRIIDDKITLYTKQNKEIENKIEVVVKQYMEYEKETFKELKSDSYITLVNLYPELKSDKMIQQQINLYTDNNKKIIELKEEKLNETIYKFLLYFGK